MEEQRMKKLALAISPGILGALFIGLFTNEWLLAFGYCIPISIVAYFSRQRRNKYPHP
jgi:hypothetical protein